MNQAYGSGSVEWTDSVDVPTGQGLLGSGSSTISSQSSNRASRLSRIGAYGRRIGSGVATRMKKMTPRRRPPTEKADGATSIPAAGSGNVNSQSSVQSSVDQEVEGYSSSSSSTAASTSGIRRFVNGVATRVTPQLRSRKDKPAASNAVDSNDKPAASDAVDSSPYSSAAHTPYYQNFDNFPPLSHHGIVSFDSKEYN